MRAGLEAVMHSVHARVRTEHAVDQGSTRRPAGGCMHHVCFEPVRMVRQARAGLDLEHTVREACWRAVSI